MAIQDAPTGELGAPGLTASLTGWLDSWEDNPHLRWPHNVQIYDRMRADGHVEGCLEAMFLPIERSTWDLDPDSVAECKPEVVQLVREDLGLAAKGTRLRRPRGAVVFGDFLRHALLEQVFGHMVFEQVAEIVAGRARLRKLAPRMPRTIQGWDLARDGGLNAIRQLVPRPNGIWDEVRIPIDRLVVFTRRKEGSDPTGRSILRSAYIHWYIKQQLIKVDAIACERNGMGYPVTTYKPDGGMSKKEALAISSGTKTGESAGAALEEGTAKLELLGVQGNVREILPSIRYHDQEISRRMLAMFLDLGHDNGARSLGDTFVDFFVMALEGVADHISQITNEHVIRDLVEWNWGPDEPYPLLKCDDITADTDLTADALKKLADGGYIVPDAALEGYLRKRYGFPTPAAPGSATAVVPVDDDTTVDEGTIEQLEARLARLKAGPRTPPVRLPSGP